MPFSARRSLCHLLIAAAVAVAGCTTPGGVKGKTARTSPVAAGKTSLRAQLEARLVDLAKVTYTTKRAAIVSNNGNTALATPTAGVVSNNGGSLAADRGTRYRLLAAGAIAPTAQPNEQLFSLQNWVDGTVLRIFESADHRISRKVYLLADGRPFREHRVSVDETWPSGHAKRGSSATLILSPDGSSLAFENVVHQNEVGLQVRRELKQPAQYFQQGEEGAITVEKLALDLVAGTGDFTLRYDAFGFVTKGRITQLEENARLSGGTVDVFDPLSIHAGTAETRTQSGTLLFTTHQTLSASRFTRRVTFTNGLALELSATAEGAGGRLLNNDAPIGKVTLETAADGTVAFLVTFDDEPGKPYRLTYGAQGASQTAPSPAPSQQPSPTRFWAVASAAGRVGGGYGDGVGTEAAFSGPSSVVLGAKAGYIADSLNHRIRRFAASASDPTQNVVSTLAGSGVKGGKDGQGLAAEFDTPSAIAVGPDETLFVTEPFLGRLRKIAPDGTVTTLAGGGPVGFVDGKGAQARFNGPTGLAVGPDGTLYVADQGNHAIRKVTPDGTVTTIAGDGTAGFAEGRGKAARLNKPVGVATDRAGNVYVTDHGNARLRRIDGTGDVTTIAGDGTALPLDGPRGEAKLARPMGLSVADDGTIFFIDGYAIRACTPGGVVSSVAGINVVPSFLSNGHMQTATFLKPLALATTPDGTMLLVADDGASQIRSVVLYLQQ
jgi:hypothetical protein